MKKVRFCNGQMSRYRYGTVNILLLIVQVVQNNSYRYLNFEGKQLIVCFVFDEMETSYKNLTTNFRCSEINQNTGIGTGTVQGKLD